MVVSEALGFDPPRRALQRVYERLLAAYGPQHWWPGDSPFEVMVGAVLTQNTAWRNVERAIANLKAAAALGPSAVAAMPPADLAALIALAGLPPETPPAARSSPGRARTGPWSAARPRKPGR